MTQDEQMFLKASLIGGRKLANREKKKVAIIRNNRPGALQSFFITTACNTRQYLHGYEYRSIYLYINPDKDERQRAMRDLAEADDHGGNYTSRL